jgi:hypothetical protein
MFSQSLHEVACECASQLKQLIEFVQLEKVLRPGHRLIQQQGFQILANIRGWNTGLVGEFECIRDVGSSLLCEYGDELVQGELLRYRALSVVSEEEEI